MKLSNLSSIVLALRKFLTRDLINLTFFVTSQCNLRCKYCFNSAALGKKDDLTLEEIKKIFSHFKTLNGILFSGGEPFMREDFYEIVDYLVTEKHLKGFGIPSNCVDSKRTLSKTEYLVNKYPHISFVICCSVDPTEELHNRLRGPGIHAKVVATVKELSKMAKEKPNLLILVNSVVTKEAVPHLDGFVDFVFNNLKPSLHSLDVVRTFNEEDRKAFADFSARDLNVIKKARLKLDDLYKAGDILMPLYKLRTKILTKTQLDCVSGDCRWPTVCLAGVTSLVLDANGDLRICENRSPLGNLRNFDYDYEKLLASRHVDQMLEDIANHKCDCNHIVCLRDSIETGFPQAVLHYLLSGFCS